MERLKRYKRQLLAVAVVTVGVTGGAYSLQRPEAEPIALVIPTAVPTATVAATVTPAPVVVFVSGEVKTPGLYTLPPGSRVGHAIEAAGGLTRTADPDAVNQAVLLTDGMQVHIPEAGITATPMTISAESDPPADSPAAQNSEKVNINTASAAELETLPKIGPVLAAEIVRHREANGAFVTIEGLLEVSGIGEATLATLRDLVTVE